MQLRTPIAFTLAATIGAVYLCRFFTIAYAEDTANFTTTWYQERRNGNLGGLTVVHPQFEMGVGLTERTTLRATYAADVVSGATAAVYSVDAISSATKFDDTRHEGAGSVTFAGSRSSVTLGATLAQERDYASISLSVASNIDLPGKNTNLSLAYAHNIDEVCDHDNGMATALERSPLVGQDQCKKRKGILGKDVAGDSVWRGLSIDTTQASVTQNVSPTLVLQAGLFGQVLHGFQSNPYRRVRIAGIDAQEHVPDVRGRLSLTVRANRYLRSAHSALHFMVRGYSDTWGVNSVTLGAGYSQYLGQHVLFRVNTRFYQQNEADFFKDAFFYDTEGTAGAYFTGDRELGAIRNLIHGAKFSYIKFDPEGGNVWGLFDEVQLNIKTELFMLGELPADSEEENRTGIDKQFLSGGQLLDAIVVQLGILLQY